MVKQRHDGEIIIKKPGGRIGSPMIVRLVGDRNQLYMPCALCDDPECKEWNVFEVWNPKIGWEKTYMHICECQMIDFCPENVSETFKNVFDYGKVCGASEIKNRAIIFRLAKAFKKKFRGVISK